MQIARTTNSSAAVLAAAAVILTFAIVANSAEAETQSGNPAAGKPWHWKSPKPLLDPRSPAPVSSRIVGGYEATPHSWPHQVALFIDDMYFCGGSLISNEWVLTAAHCMDSASFVQVVMGAHNIRVNEGSQLTMNSTEFFIHEGWHSYFLVNDIALIKLPSAVSFNANIQDVRLPSSNVSVGTFVTSTGWGRTSDSSSITSSVLHQVSTPIISHSDCQSYYQFITNKNVCIDTKGGKGPCNGDNGGPLNHGGKIYGIISFGSSAGCEAGYPVVFTSTVAYLDWIHQKTGITS